MFAQPWSLQGCVECQGSYAGKVFVQARSSQEKDACSCRLSIKSSPNQEINSLPELPAPEQEIFILSFVIDQEIETFVEKKTKPSQSPDGMWVTLSTLPVLRLCINKVYKYPPRHSVV